MTKKLQAFAFCIAGLLSAFVYVSGVYAATMTRDLNDSGWMIDFDKDKVTVVDITGFKKVKDEPDAIKEGAIILVKKFGTAAAIDIKFIEKVPATANSFGLRVKSLSETIKNTSKLNLTGFTFELIDPNSVLTKVENDAVTGTHPGFAHFHKDTGQIFPGSAGDPGFTPEPNPAATGALQDEKITLTGGKIGAEKSSDLWVGIGIHQIEQKGQQRNFILRQTPILTAVPLPAALPLSLAALALIGTSLRRRHT